MKTVMKTVTIQCKLDPYGTNERTEMTLPCAFTRGCLAVHQRPQLPPGWPTPLKPKREYTITHIPTGRSTSSRVILTTKALAIRVCKDLAALDWSGVTPDGGIPGALSAAIQGVYVAHGLLS